MNTKLKPLIFLIAIAFLLPLAALPQSNYKSGYVVTTKGDTVKGFVDYREWDNNPTEIDFRGDANGKITKYGAGDIKAFSVDRIDAYRSFTVTISTAAINPDKVDYNRDTTVRTATVFLRILEQGNRMALYSYRDDVKVRYYIGDAPGYTPTELIYRIYISPNWEYNYQAGGGNGKDVTENIFRKQLSAEALKYDEWKGDLVALIARSEYIEDNILSIVKKINHTTKAQYAKSHYSGSAFGFFAGAAVSINTISPAPLPQAYYANGGQTRTSFGPYVSLGVNLYANPATRRLQLRLELAAAQNSYKDLFTARLSPYVPTEATYNKTIYYISPQVIYNIYNRETFKIFVGAGAAFSHFSYSNAYFGSQNHDGSEANIAANNPYYFNTTDNTFILKTGVQFTRHLLIYIATQSKADDTLGGYFSLSSTYNQAGINYIF